MSWQTRTERLTTADLPAGCDECGALVGITETGQVVDGVVLADAQRDYVFCTEHGRRVREVNPTARVVKLPQPVSTPE